MFKGFCIFLQSETSIRRCMQNMRLGVFVFFFCQKLIFARIFEKSCFLVQFVSICMFFVCFNGLVCMQMALNFNFEGYTSYSIIWNHIKSYLNHVQSHLFGKKQSARTMFLNFFTSCSIQPFSIRNRSYTAYYILLHPYIYLRSIILIYY